MNSDHTEAVAGAQQRPTARFKVARFIRSQTGYRLCVARALTRIRTSYAVTHPRKNTQSHTLARARDLNIVMFR